MEEKNQRNPDFNEESIQCVKTSLMGRWPAGSAIPIAQGIAESYRRRDGIYFAQQAAAFIFRADSRPTGL